MAPSRSKVSTAAAGWQPPHPLRMRREVAMRTRAARGLHVTELGLGGAQFGNLYRAMTDEVAAATFDAAWTSGIRYLDTAPHYGLGLSERRFGALLRNRPRSEYVLSSKVGRLLVANPDGSDERDD